ncbi:filamentous hemagglutinin N-terminal domain-containing protein [Burkholderia sp. L27(2015)]|uniref:two-partner secretion domain-containing protein n=1 Tax=Burkholderia sp. L27(2015) TaxID=1641858 RepID=UPI00131B7212|nr:filamentous hemagglutinin N-terminal domain-containing protein [Burkholderia sp. L27(2015)]
MNHIYRLVWSRVANSWVAVAETACGKAKSKSRVRKLTAASLSVTAVVFSLSPPAYAANASNASIAAGNGTATVATVGTTTTINQTSQRAVIDWTKLSTASNEALVFNQPNASAIALNRITGTSPSIFMGSLSANGQVYILNPNGVVFGADSQVNVGGLVASTMRMDANAFMNGSATFTSDSTATGSVVNKGTLTAADGGYIALLGGSVRNEGTIIARLGTVALGAGSNITLTFSGNSLVHMQVDQSVLATLAKNGGLIQADGGLVMMTAGAANSLLASVVNNTGTIEARTIQNHNGVITLLGGMEAGSVNVGGTLDASATNGGNGGAIETSAATVNVAKGAVINTQAPQGLMGSWLIDPTDFTVAASGGNITGAALSAELGLTNMTIDTVHTTGSGAGDINVNDAVNWSSNSANASSNTLTLNAANNININAPITWGVSGTPGNATTTGALVLNAGNDINIGAAVNAFWRAPLTMNTGPVTSTNPSTVNVNLLPNAGGFAGAVNFYSDAGVTAAGGTGLLTVNGNNYTVISDVTPGSGVGVAGDTGTDSLQGIQNNQSGYYALGSNIDASATASWNGGTGFNPISNFLGVFDGLGHTIGGVAISSGNYSVGLFGVNLGTVRNVGMVNASVSGGMFDGALVGNNYGQVIGGILVKGIVSNSYATGAVSGINEVGGLVGSSQGTVANSYANVSVRGGNNLCGNTCGVGGLVGSNFNAVQNSYAIGNVLSTEDAGGLVGSNFAGTISNSYATGTVFSRGIATGGLVGYGNQLASIDHSYATGTVSGSGDLGGLVGLNTGAIGNSYATGNLIFAYGVISGTIVGGLAGFNNAQISNSYATGAVFGTDKVGGLIGWNTGTIDNSYATGAVSGSTNVGGLVGQNSIETVGVALINNSYATGAVTGTTSASTGALVGSSDTSLVQNSFYASDANPGLTGIGGAADVGGTVWGMNTAAMENSANFTSATGTSSVTDHSGNGGVNPGWDFPGAGNGAGSTWFMYNGFTTPLLQAFLKPLTITANSVSKQYDGTAYSGNNGVTYSVTPDLSLLLGTLSYGGSAQGAVNIGSYAITPSGFYSTGQQGYMITFVNGSLSINPVQSTTNTNTTTGTGSSASTTAGQGVGSSASTTAGQGVALSASTTAGQVVASVLSDQSRSNQANSSDTLPSQTNGAAAGGVVTINLGGNGSTLQIQSDSGS